MPQNDNCLLDDNPSSAFGTFSPHEGRRVSMSEPRETVPARPVGRVRGELALRVINVRDDNRDGPRGRT